MAEEFSLWSLGLGVVLGWALLPLFVKLAKRSQSEAPAAYYRALVGALALATALLLAPTLRAWSGAGIELGLAPERFWPSSGSVIFVADWVRPLFGSREEPWSSMPLAYVLSGVAVVWLLLVSAGVAHSLWGRIELWRAYRSAAFAAPTVMARAESVAAELGIRAPEIRVADGLGSAFTFGLWAPVVVLDAEACRGQEAELDFILRHELLHVARSDTRAAFWIDLAQRCFTGHPCLRRLAAEIRFAREARVDELAAGAAPLEYARFLVTSAERQRSLGAPSPSLVSMADTALERRVEMLMTSTRRASRFWQSSSWLGLCGLALGALVLLAPSSWGQGGVDYPLELSPPLDERNERAAAEAGGYSQRLPPEVIRKIVRDHFDGFRLCYEAVPQPRPTLSIKMEFTIDRDGTVSDGQVRSEEQPEFASCVEGVMRSMVFPAPKDGIVTVVYPIQFAP